MSFGIGFLMTERWHIVKRKERAEQEEVGLGGLAAFGHVSTPSHWPVVSGRYGRGEWSCVFRAFCCGSRHQSKPVCSRTSLQKLKLWVALLSSSSSSYGLEKARWGPFSYWLLAEWLWVLRHTLGLVLWKWRLVPRQPPAPAWSEALWRGRQQGNCLRVFAHEVDSGSGWGLSCDQLPLLRVRIQSLDLVIHGGEFSSQGPALLICEWECGKHSAGHRGPCWRPDFASWSHVSTDVSPGPGWPLWDNGVWTVSTCAD